MKKTIGAIALVLAVFSMLYVSNMTLAYAGIKTSPSAQTVDVSNLDVASLTISDLDGASSVKFVARNSASMDAFQTITTLGSISATGTYFRSAADLQTQFGNVVLEWKAVDNNNSSHESGLCNITVQP